MANSSQVDYYIAQILDLQKLLSAIDGVQPIVISIGDYKLIVDPHRFPAAYKAGSDVLTSVSLGAINDYKVAISEEIVAQAQIDASGTEVAQQPTTGSTTSPSDSTGTSNQPTTPATTEVTSEPSSSSTVTAETTTTQATSDSAPSNASTPSETSTTQTV